MSRSLAWLARIARVVSFRSVFTLLIKSLPRRVAWPIRRSCEAKIETYETWQCRRSSLTRKFHHYLIALVISAFFLTSAFAQSLTTSVLNTIPANIWWEAGSELGYDISGPAGFFYHYNDPTTPCAFYATKFNAGNGRVYGYSYINPRGMYSTNYGWGCMYDLLYNNGTLIPNQFYQHYVLPYVGCPSGYDRTYSTPFDDPSPHGTCTATSVVVLSFASASSCSKGSGGGSGGGGSNGSSSRSNGSPSVGNPIYPGSQLKIQVEQDIAPLSSGLGFSRYYRSDFQNLVLNNFAPLSLLWTHTYSRYLSFGYDASSVIQTVYAYRADGSLLIFVKDAGTGAWISKADTTDQLTEAMDGGGNATGWTLVTNATSETESYSATGRLAAIETSQGQFQNLVYSDNTTSSSIAPRAGLLIQVVDSFGRSINLTYDSQARIATLTDPSGSVITYGYDSSNRLASVTYPGNKVRTYLYNETGLGTSQYALTGILDENGNRYATFGYDINGRASLTEHAGGMADTYSISYGTNSATVTDPLNASRTYSFLTNLGSPKNTGISQSISNNPGCSDGNNAASVYDDNGNLTSREDFNNNYTCYVYDTTRNLETVRGEGLTSACPASLSSWSPAAGTAQRKISTQWHPDWRVPTARTEPLKLTTWVYNGQPDPTNGNSVLTCAPSSALVNGLPIPVLCKKIEQPTTDTNGSLGFNAATTGTARIWSYTYNSYGQMLTSDGPRTDVNDITSFGYDSQGNLTTITNALNQVTRITRYDANDRPLTIVDPNGLATTLTYAPRGWLTSRSISDGTTTETTYYDYDGVGQLTKITLPDGSYLSYGYDAAHRLTDIADSLGDHIHYTLDALGNHTAGSVYDPNNTLTQTRSHVFNALNRLYQDIGAQSQTTTYSYDNNGNLTGISDPLAHATANSYDALNRLVQVTDPNNGVTHYGYDAQNYLTQVTDPRSLQTTYAYDALDNLTQQVSPDTGTTTYTYDAAGNIVTKTDARNQTTTYTYDALNRLTTIAYTGGSYTFEYDLGANAIGKLDQMLGSGGAKWSYDSHGRVSNRLTWGSIDTGYGYDSAGRLNQIAYPSGKIVTYSYDSQGRISGIFVDGQTILSDVHYAPFGGVTGWTWGNGAAYNRTIDSDGRIASYTLNGITRSLTYDAASRITALNGDTTQTFSYDNLDRLSGYTTPTTTQAYGYDADGNRTALTIDTNNYIYTYPTTSNRLTSTTGPTVASYSYDAAGKASTDGTRNFYYDALGRLNDVTRGSYTLYSSFNGLGQRDSTSDYVTSGTYYVYGEAGHLLGEYYHNKISVRENVYLGNIPVAVLTDQETLVDNSNSNVSMVGTWTTAQAPDVQGPNYRYHAAGTGTNNFKWLPIVTNAGDYRVYARWAAGADRATNAPYTIATASGDVTVTVDQQQNDAQWMLLGTYAFNANQVATITLTDNANGTVVADAIKLVPVAVTTTYYVYTDQLNTPRVITDTNNTTVWRWDSDPFGTTAANEDPDMNRIIFTYNLRFPGQYYDKWTGLIYNYFRDYDPTIGRYIESDPIGLGGGVNTYLYGDANPLGNSDPTGEGGNIGIAYPSPRPPVPAQSIAERFAAGAVDVAEVAMGLARGGALGLAAMLSGDTPQGCESNEEREQRCNANLEMDLASCRALGKRNGPGAYKICEGQAVLRYGNCLSGRDRDIDAPLPPFGTKP